MSIAEYKKIIKSMMSENRYNHCVNVSKEAVKLAKRYGGDEEKAAIAGILHDITKEMPKEEQLQIMLDSGIILDDIQKNAPKLWHGISGSVYIKKHFGIEDEDILNAICYHTTGRAGMSLLEKIIFVADFTSEERTYKGVATMRKKSRKSLEDAMLYGFKFTFSDLSSRELAIHPDELACYNEIVLNNPTKGKSK
ncbi:bis(5'-nucleosyl)-tetraphosphatase (symmetrical) YqeK [Ruminococcus sp.]|uniref:bis(5'-nucleosyl)-tetraphosphatase (symmetrical) YqeK n=1 Tax=Ruminococcus sp. TaxID=41978 RepID=UPI0025E79636|nr:bis(5'-nucleosyl)-tetraphosphatase (symmetrical) YqeK [Ruminococcus sp.]MCI6616199.1 bis(5'-nucleosyl)-tetraphosphatase (symmetrical) YqeK [Ruminococcus sp.]